MNTSVKSVIALVAVSGCDLVGENTDSGAETGTSGTSTGLTSTGGASSSSTATSETTGTGCADAPAVAQPCAAIFTKLADECDVANDQILYLDVYRDCYYDVTYAGDGADPRLSDRYACISALPCLELRDGDPEGICDCHAPSEPEGTTEDGGDTDPGECLDTPALADPCGVIVTKLIDECGVADDQTFYYDVVRDCVYGLEDGQLQGTYEEFVQWYSCISTLPCEELRAADPEDRCTCHQP